jgi:hypothetical protein
MAGKTARAAVERCGKQPKYNHHARPHSIRVQREFGTLQTLIDFSLLTDLSRRRPAKADHCSLGLPWQTAPPFSPKKN